MSSRPKKYIFDNGVMKINPEFTAWNAVQDGVVVPLAKPADQIPLAVVSSMDDVAVASVQQLEATGTNLQLAESTTATMEIMQEEEFTNEFEQPGGVDGSDLLDGLTEYFVKFEVPVGLINKLMALKQYDLRFIVDDSGSMNAKTDSMLSEASDYVLRGQPKSRTDPMTRWQEAETRIHNMIDILAFIPIKMIEIRFLNASNVISLRRTGKTMEEFTRDSHTQIADTFSSIPVKYKTPTLRVMREVFQAASASLNPCMYYLLTDGVPSDSSVQQVADLIKYRLSPERNPVTLISCTNEDEESEWMKQVEEIAPFCSEVDDYQDEKAEVEKDQGVGFPYTKGYWLISQLVAAINPYDLDAIDENLPFTKHTLDNLLGRVHTPQDYQYYFERNTHASLYLDVYERFLNDKGFARNIISRNDQDKREKKAGYKRGERRSAPPPPSSLSSRLANITSRAR